MFNRFYPGNKFVFNGKKYMASEFRESLTPEQQKLYSSAMTAGKGLFGAADRVHNFDSLMDSLSVEQTHQMAVIFGHKNAMPPGAMASQKINRHLVYTSVRQGMRVNILNVSAEAGKTLTGWFYGPNLKGAGITQTLKYLRWSRAEQAYEFKGNLDQIREARVALYGE